MFTHYTTLDLIFAIHLPGIKSYWIKWAYSKCKWTHTEFSDRMESNISMYSMSWQKHPCIFLCVFNCVCFGNCAIAEIFISVKIHTNLYILNSPNIESFKINKMYVTSPLHVYVVIINEYLWICMDCIVIAIYLGNNFHVRNIFHVGNYFQTTSMLLMLLISQNSHIFCGKLH